MEGLWDLAAVHRLMQKRPLEGSAPLKQPGRRWLLRAAGVWPPDARCLPLACAFLTAAETVRPGNCALGRRWPSRPADASWPCWAQTARRHRGPAGARGPREWRWEGRRARPRGKRKRSASRGAQARPRFLPRRDLDLQPSGPTRAEFSLLLRDWRWGVGDGLFPCLIFPNNHIRGYTRKTA